MAFSLPDLPYAMDALAPHLSQRTLEFHYGKHHKGYVDKLNAQISGTPFESASLEEIIREAAGDPEQAALFNNAAQVWNHTFYWRSMTPGGGGTPKGEMATALDQAFGGLDGFKDAFSAAGATQFGSGWAWLVARAGKLEVRKTPNAETPLTEPGVSPLLTMDVWEHAYYLDHQNRRGDYFSAFIDHLANWAFAESNFAST